MATRKLELLEVKSVYTGTNASGKEFTIYEITARDPDKGTLVQVPLRSFDNLPLGVGQYDVSRFEREGKETTYTVKKPGNGGGGGGQATAALAQRLTLLEEAFEMMKQSMAELRARQQPVLPSTSTTQAQGSTDDDDIPF